MNKYDKVDLVGTLGSEYHAKVKELLKSAKERDAGKVRIKHPTLPNTWLFVSPERANK